jgi:hypothetical protein
MVEIVRPQITRAVVVKSEGPQGVMRGAATPYAYGGKPMDVDQTGDQTAAVQAAIDAAAASWDATQEAYSLAVDLAGATWRCAGSLDMTNIRQPGLNVRNGEIYSTASGKVAIDAAGSNHITFTDVEVIGDETTPPAVGFLLARIEDGAVDLSSLPASPDMGFHGSCGSRGYFSKAALVNLASEVSSLGTRSYWTNKHRALTAVCLAYIDTQEASVDLWGEEITSDFVTVQRAVNGRNSNICHHWGQVHAERAADFNLGIASISKADPAVVTVATGTLAGASLSNGDTVVISGGNMSEVSYRVFTVANINAGADTFELSGIDSSGYTTYTGGATLQNQTGPAVYVAGAKTVRAHSGYLLTYGAPSIVVNCGNSSQVRDWHVNFQSERQAATLIELQVPSGIRTTIPNFHFTAPQTSQSARDEVVKITGGGDVDFDDGSLEVSSMGTAPANGLFSPGANFRFNGFHISSPLAAPLPDPAVTPYVGTMLAQGRDPKLTLHGLSLFDFKQIVADTTPGALTAQGLRFGPDSLYIHPEAVGAERAVLVNDRATTANLNSAAHRVNTSDKYSGKMAWNTSTARPVWATGGVATSSWVYADGTTAHTPA